jgi:hypothetical protein
MNAVSIIGRMSSALIQNPAHFFCIKTLSHETPILLTYSDYSIS